MHDLTAFKHRVEKNLKRLKPWAAKQRTNAFRVYESDIPELKYIVDWYDGYGVVSSVFLKESPHEDEELRLVVSQALGIAPDRVFLKVRQRIKSRQDQYHKSVQEGLDSILITVEEESSRYLVNLSDYLDTGLFLDHRPLRSMMRQLPRGLQVLNLFCYTGSISVAAAQSGAHVTSVDLSATYLKWAEKNFSLNQIPLDQHTFVEASVWDYLKPKNADHATHPVLENTSDPAVEGFDVIILDPPTFSNSKKTSHSFDVQRDHRRLIKLVLPLLKPEGTLWFSTNFRKFSLDPLIPQELLCEEWTHRTIPEDFRNKLIHRSYRLRFPR